MPDIDEIHRLKEYYVNDLYSTVRTQQKTDLMYRDDTFPVPEVREPHRVLRLGVGARMVDSPAEQIVTSNPQAHFDIIKGNQDSALKLSKVVNDIWLPALRVQNPNPFKEALKNKLSRGESYIRVSPNLRWLVSPNDERTWLGLPVLFIMLDPMVIYGSPEEDDCGWYPNCGVPNKVIVFYERQPLDVIMRYPTWSNPKGKGIGDNKQMVEWLEYWDKNERYFEADGERILTEEQVKNAYGFVPFVRKYSGFGRRSPLGELADLIVSDLRWNRDLIKELCIMASDISSRMHLSAHKAKTFITPGEVDEEDIRENMSFGAYDLNILQNVPEGSKFADADIETVSPQEFQHYFNTWNMLTQRNPFLIAGSPFGTSGRQQDMTQTSAFRRYDAPLENTELEFSTAIEMGLKMCQRIPGLRPEGLSEKDLEAKFHCYLSLAAKDPIEEDRKITLGERLWNAGNGSIDLRTNLIEFQGRTQEQAEEIIANLLVDKLTIYNPDVASVMGMVFAEESGMMEWIQKAKMRQAEMEQGGGLQKPSTKTGQERALGEAQTQLGMEMQPEPMRGGRTPPQRYTR